MKRIMNFRLCYQGKVLELCSYSDTDLAGDLDKTKLITGYVFTFGGGVVSSDSKNRPLRLRRQLKQSI